MSPSSSEFATTGELGGESSRPGEADPAVGRIESFDLEEYQDVVLPWEVRFDQLSGGAFHSWLQYVKTPGMLLYEEYWHRSVAVRGSTPDGFVMFGTCVASAGSQVDWCGGEVDERRFACSGPAADVDFRIRERSRDVVLLVSPELLAEAFGREMAAWLCGKRHIDFSGNRGLELVDAIRATVRRYAAQPRLLEGSFETRSVESSLLAVLGGCIAAVDGGAPAKSDYAGAVTVRRAIEYLDGFAGPITALELASAAGVSQRTLEYAFKRRLGTTPYSYIRLHRLNGVRRELVDADMTSSTITQAALKWGFNHPGRFSVEYRRLFGEKPSDTLRGVRGSPEACLLDSTRSL